MFRTLIIAIWIGISAPAYIWLAQKMATGIWPAFWFDLDIDHKTWTPLILQFVGLVFVGAPIAALVFQLVSHFTKRSKAEEFRHNTIGTTNHKISWFMRLVALAACIFIFGAMVWDFGKMEEPLGMWLFASPLLAFLFYALLYILLFKVSFDNNEITAMNPFFRAKTYPWSALSAYSNHENWGEFRLHFGDQGLARIPYYVDNFANLSRYAYDIVEQKNALLEERNKHPRFG